MEPKLVRDVGIAHWGFVRTDVLVAGESVEVLT